MKHPSGLAMIDPEQVNPWRCYHWSNDPMEIGTFFDLLDSNEIDEILIPDEESVYRDGNRVSRVILQRGDTYQMVNLGPYQNGRNWFGAKPFEMNEAMEKFIGSFEELSSLQNFS